MNKLKTLRSEFGLSVRQVAPKVGLTYTQISRLENDTYRLNDEALVILSNFYQVTTDYILGLSNEGIKCLCKSETAEFYVVINEAEREEYKDSITINSNYVRTMAMDAYYKLTSVRDGNEALKQLNTYGFFFRISTNPKLVSIQKRLPNLTEAQADSVLELIDSFKTK